MLPNKEWHRPHYELRAAAERTCTEGDERSAIVSDTMNPEPINALATESLKKTAPVFNVAILYESSEAGARAKHFSDQLATGVAANRVLNLDQWDFRFLGRRAIRNAAASAAAVADLVILSMSGEKPLPARVERWIEMWTWLIDGRKPDVVALFASHHPESGRIQAYLRRGAINKGLTFFPETACRMANEGRVEAPPGSDLMFGANSHQIAQTVQ